jgi:hypothetical protein
LDWNAYLVDQVDTTIDFSTTPNATMLGNIDMNSNDIQNAADIEADTMTLDSKTVHSLLDSYNGTFLEPFDALVTSDGATITMSLEKSGTGDLTMVFSDGNTTLDCTPACTIALTAGSDSSPQSNYIYIPQSTKVLTKSTTSFPTAAEHIKVGYFFVPSAGYVQTDGVYVNQNWNDHATDSNNQGHLSHISERSRRDGAYYFSGIDANGTDQAAASSYFDWVAGNEAYFKSTSGIIYQLHRHSVPAFDSSGASDDIHVINWNGDAYHEISDLGDIVADSAGGSLSNKYFNLFFFAVGNKSGEYSPMMCQLPDGSYNSQVSAENDVDGFDNLSMPREFALESSTGVPICRMTLRYTGGTATLSHISTVDLRGKALTAGSGGTGAITNFADNQFTVFNVTDNTKIFDIDAGTNITTGNTRTLIMADRDVDLQDPTFDSVTLIDGGTVGQAAGPLLTFDDASNYLEVTGCNVGIGIATPDNLLHVHNATAGSIASTANSLLTLENNTTTYQQFLSPNTAVQGILFGDVDDADVGFIEYNHSSNFMRFGINAAERIRIDSAGSMGLGRTPTVNLDVYKASGSPKILVESGDANAALEVNAFTGFESRLILAENGTQKWKIYNDGDDSDKLKIQDDGDDRIIVDQSGNVNFSGDVSVADEFQLNGTLISAPNVLGTGANNWANADAAQDDASTSYYITVAPTGGSDGYYSLSNLQNNQHLKIENIGSDHAYLGAAGGGSDTVDMASGFTLLCVVKSGVLTAFSIV